MKFQVFIIIFGPLLLLNPLVQADFLRQLKRGTRIYPEKPTPSEILLKLDSYRDLKLISPLIYGVVAPTNGPASPSNTTLLCLCGTEYSTYNWETNSTYDGTPGKRTFKQLPGATQVGGYITHQIKGYQDRDNAILITIPSLGFVSKKAERSKKGFQTLSDFYKSKLQKEQLLSFEPDLKDQMVYQDEFVHWVENKALNQFRSKIYYKLDYRPDQWPNNFPNLRKEKLRYEELVQTTVQFSKTIKEMAPETLVFGPGIEGLRSFKSLQGAPDYFQGYFIDFYLKKLNFESQKSKRRLLDVLDIHWTPKGLTKAERIQASRGIWDPDYSFKDHNGVQQKPNLIQRLQTKIDRYFPNTLIAFSEYDWGGGDDISGALATADSLGAFGKNGIFAAAMPTESKRAPFNEIIFELFKNYDQKGSGFGDISFFSTSSNPQSVSIYSSFSPESQDQLTALVVNRTSKAKKASLEVVHDHLIKTAEIYTVTSGAPKIKRGNDVSVNSRNSFSVGLKPYSVNLIRMKSRP